MSRRRPVSVTLHADFSLCSSFKLDVQLTSALEMAPSVAYSTGGGRQGAVKSRRRGEKANTPPFGNCFWNFLNKHEQRGDPLEIFYGPSLQIELDAPLGTLLELREISLVDRDYSEKNPLRSQYGAIPRTQHVFNRLIPFISSVTVDLAPSWRN